MPPAMYPLRTARRQMTYQHQMLDDDFDMEEDATRVQPSPFAYGGTQIAYGSGGSVLQSLPD